MRGLERVEMEASKEGEDAIEAGDFVDAKGEGYELGGCTERDDAKDRLRLSAGARRVWVEE